MTLLGASTVRRLLDEAGIIPSKGLGQNFVIDPGTIERIVRIAGVGPGDDVIEVGPGLGSLTLGLLAAGANVTAVEADERLVSILDREIDDPLLRVVHADATDLDWQTLLGDVDSWTLVANLPYNVATMLLLDLLEKAPTIDSFLVMMQREPAERLAVSPGVRAASGATVKRAWFADAHIAGIIGRGVFYPQPNVDSALVSIRRRPSPNADREKVFALVDAAFGKRRKMLRRSLVDHVNAEAFVASGIDPTARPETLSIDQWVALASQ
ncbi:MAG: 16S rRNA (adenine(1518)-N(6)/adenine(1519)-N(6))-dimethyltransferase RsmA [Acidobacteria bacterium]|nr:16S rRNA (adenine(1518)-N(6)/adenine(1519)-N(6))-dimethyltransferase RsmA [Acidobacteriota bacterium]